VWTLDELADALAAALTEREASLTTEQTFSGLDSMSEVQLHEVMAGSLASSGWAVLREVPFPSQVRSKRLTKDETSRQAAQRSERERCDLVVLPERGEGGEGAAGGGQTLLDPRDDYADDLERAASLFAEVGPGEDVSSDAAQAVRPQDAWWLEFKSVGQFSVPESADFEGGGEARANKSYSSFVSGVLRDARKLNSDPLIELAACGLVLFTAERAIAEHDLGALMHRLLDKNAPIREQVVRHLPISDRIGNAWCSIALMRVRCDAAMDAAFDR